MRNVLMESSRGKSAYCERASQHALSRLQENNMQAKRSCAANSAQTDVTIQQMLY